MKKKIGRKKMETISKEIEVGMQENERKEGEEEGLGGGSDEKAKRDCS